MRIKFLFSSLTQMTTAGILSLFIAVPMLKAQTAATVIWKLDSVATTSASTTGNVIGLPEVIGADTTGFIISGYKNGYQRLNQGSKVWVKEPAQNEGRYVEFKTTCSDTTTGSYFNVSNVSLNYGGAGSTSAMNGNVWYSTDRWTTRTEIGAGLVFPNSTLISFSSSLSVMVARGDTLSLRLYPYWVINNATSTTKYVCLDSVVIAGTSGTLSVPSVTTASITNITLTTAIGGGTITSANGSPVTARGVCWNTTGMPVVTDHHTSDSSGAGVFTSALTGLSDGTYYVRAYATNSTGTGYGAQASFTIRATALSPIVTTAGVTNITTVAAHSGGTVNSDGGVAVIARGVCWNSRGLPTTADNFTTDGTGVGSFSSSLNNLSANTMYDVRAYAVNSVGTSYGEQVTFTTGQRIDSMMTGAYGDGVHLDTKAIQAAIDSMAGLGGGTVLLTHGKFLSGPLTLKSNITFSIDSTATLLASQNVHLYYPAGADTTKAATSLIDFVTSSYANNITITGNGTIDGQGSPWWAAENVAKAYGSDTLRPRLIELENGSHIVVTHITLKNAPMFHLCPNSCYDVVIDSVTILAPSDAPNTDGIDPGKCHHVRITNCVISNGDDNVAVGSSSTSGAWPDAASSDIIVSHGTFGTGHGVSIGSYTSGGVDSMLVDSCSFSGTTNGIRIKSARDRGGNIRNITYSNLNMNNVRYPIYLTEYYPSIPASDTAQPVTSTTPYYHNLTIKNLTSTNAASNSMVGYIVGLPESKMDNIHFKNVSIRAYAGLQVRNAQIDTTGTSISVMSGSAYILQTNSTITAPITGVDHPATAALPASFELNQNYPNPFNPSTTISFFVPNRTIVTLKLYDLLGREVAVLLNDVPVSAGTHEAVWDASRAAGGVYFYRITAGSIEAVKKLVLLK